MEAVGAASAILGLLGFTAKAILQIYEVYSTYKDAPDTVFRTTRDLRDLSRILEQILDIVNESRDEETTCGSEPTRAGHARVLEKLLTRDDNLVAACHTEIASILKLLETSSRLTWPLRKKDIEKHLETVESLKAQLGLVVQSQTMATLLGIERVIASQTSVLQKHIQDEAAKKALRWLKAPDVLRNLRTAIEKRQPGTGEWFVSSPEFQTWLSSPRFLWVTGIPGAGKTILSSTIIAALLCQQEGSSNAVVFSYFDFQDASKQQSDTLLQAILAQLATRNSEVLKRLMELHDECSGPREPSSDELLSAVTTALTSFPKTFVVVDAVDECSDRRMLLKHLKTLSELPNVHLIAFSRKETDIEQVFRSIVQEITLTTKGVDNDIAMYVKHRMESSDDMAFWVPHDKERVQEYLKSKAGGMFRWAQCQLDTLELCTSSEEIDEVLRSLPKDLPATYERILARVNGRQFKSVWTVLVCLAFATKPLTINEVVNILRIDPRLKPPTKDITIYQNRLLAACSSLISTFSYPAAYKSDTPKLYIRLAHLSVKEYLVSEEIQRSAVSAFWVSHGLGNRILAELCIGCLLQNDDVRAFGRPALRTFPLTRYAANNWGRHAGEANAEETGRELLDHLLLKFLDITTPDVQINWRRAAGSDCSVSTRAGLIALPAPWIRDTAIVEMPVPYSELQTELLVRLSNWSICDSPLVLATQHNLWRTVEELIRARQPGKNDLDKAMCRGLKHHAYDSLEVLVTVGEGNVNSLNEDERTLLQRCETPGGVRWLVAHGAHLRPADSALCPPLHFFCNGNTSKNTAPSTLVATLLELGADPEMLFEGPLDVGRQIHLVTPLQRAAYRGDIKSVRVLLDYGASVNRVEGSVGSSLHAAALGGSEDVFQHLLTRGGDIHTFSERYGSLIWAAGYGGKGEIVKACLEQGVCWNEFIDTALESARGCQWRELDHETQEYLTNRIIQLSWERRFGLSEAVEVKC